MEAHSDAQLAFLYGHAKACIMPQIEDFGYVSLEAQICSCPVIAYNEGGATESVRHLKTGFLFKEQTSHGIITAIESFEEVAPTIDHHLQAYGSDVVEPVSYTHLRKGWMYDSIFEEVKRLNIEDSVVFTGYVKSLKMFYTNAIAYIPVSYTHLYIKYPGSW